MIIIIVLCTCDLFYKMEDDIIPAHFEPVAWKDSMIFLATDNGPCQVQLWDTETCTLVKRYMFSMNDRYMYIGEMAVDNDCFWINLVGKSETLIQVNAATGTVRRINIDMQARYLQYIEGYLWVFNPHIPREGMRVRQYDREGTLIQSFAITQYAIDHVPYKSIHYINGDFLVPVRKYIRKEETGNCHYIANLSKGGELYEIPLESLYPGTMFNDIENIIYDSFLIPPDPKECAFYWHQNIEYASILFVNARKNWRWYYNMDSYIPLELSGPVITYHRDGDRSDFYFNITGDYIFTGGRILKQLDDNPTFRGLEIGVYPVGGGDEIEFFRLWNSNQITYAKKNGKTWFAKNIWSWDYENDKWNLNGEIEAYFLDEINVKLYRVNAGGDIYPVI